MVSRQCHHWRSLVKSEKNHSMSRNYNHVIDVIQSYGEKSKSSVRPRSIMVGVEDSVKSNRAAVTRLNLPESLFAQSRRLLHFKRERFLIRLSYAKHSGWSRRECERKRERDRRRENEKLWSYFGWKLIVYVFLFTFHQNSSRHDSGLTFNGSIRLEH